MTGDLSDPYYLDDLFDGLTEREDVPRAHRIYANWYRNRTGAGLGDGQEDLAEHVAVVIDTFLPPDHDSIADIRTTVAEHVDLDLFPNVSPETVGRVIEQVVIAADNVVLGPRLERQAREAERKRREEYEWLMESGYGAEPPYEMSRLMRWLIHNRTGQRVANVVLFAIGFFVYLVLPAIVGLALS